MTTLAVALGWVILDSLPTFARNGKVGTASFEGRCRDSEHGPGPTRFVFMRPAMTCLSRSGNLARWLMALRRSGLTEELRGQCGTGCLCRRRNLTCGQAALNF